MEIDIPYSVRPHLLLPPQLDPRRLADEITGMSGA